MRSASGLASLLLLAVVATACFTVEARGELTLIGDPEPGGSWFQSFGIEWEGMESFAVFAVEDLSDPARGVDSGAFADTPISDFFDVEGGGRSKSWGLEVETGFGAIAAGRDPDGRIGITLHFSGEASSQAVSLVFLAFGDEGVYLGNATASYDPESLDAPWTLSAASLSLEDVEVMMGQMVPLPAPVALAGAGFLTLLVGRKRLRRALGA